MSMSRLQSLINKKKEQQLLNKDKKYQPRKETDKSYVYTLVHIEEDVPKQKKIKEDSSENQEENQLSEQKAPTMAKSEVTRRLRAHGQPIILFGETDWQREHRLIQFEAKRTESEDQSGMKDDFGLDIKSLEEESDSKVASLESEMNDLPDLAEKDIQTKEDEILFRLTKLLKEWEAELNDRPDTVRRTAQGRVQTATYKQTCRHIRPLFRLLQTKTLAPDLLIPMHGIVKSLQKRLYVNATDSYLKMAIGNAPWPMGVTMVGIHERSAREKISSHQVAHVLNDETQRKFIQAVKRLITFCQRKYPNDPSLCVEKTTLDMAK